MSLTVLFHLWIHIMQSTVNTVQYHISFSSLFRNYSMARPRYHVGPGMDVQVTEADDIVTLNLNANDIVGELLRVFVELRIKLTFDGVHSQENTDRPFVKLVLNFHDNHRKFSTALLIKRGFCYCYSFFANGSWRNVSDSPYNLVDEEMRPIANLDFDSGYTPNDPKKAGLRNLAVPVMTLSGNHSSQWKYWYIHLVFIFIESARLEPVARYFLRLYSKRVKNCLVECSQHMGRSLTLLRRDEAVGMMCALCRERLDDLLQSEVYDIKALPYLFRGEWGNLCDALNHQGPGWNLNPAIASKLRFPTSEAGQRESVTNAVRIIKPRPD